MLAHSIQTLHLGKVVGCRTWGGVLSVDAPTSMVDGRYVNRYFNINRFNFGIRVVILGFGVCVRVVYIECS